MTSNLMDIEEKIAAAAEHCGRVPKDITLVAVSKVHIAETILPVLESGQRVFGENRVQEAAQKWPALKNRFDNVKLMSFSSHLIFIFIKLLPFFIKS